jgi:hypothetical protein
MFISYLKFKMTHEFIDFIKILQEKINEMNYANCPNWMESFTKSIILFESQTKDKSDKYQTINDINKLYNGFLEIYDGILPEVLINDLVIVTNHKGKKTVGILINSSYFLNMRAQLADIFGYKYYPENDILVKKFKSSDNTEIYINEPFNIVMPIISESYIKKGISIFNVYSVLNDIIHSLGVHNKIFQTTSFVYETENKRGKKLQLW